MIWEWNYAFETVPVLLEGLGMTVYITVVAAALALIFGFMLALVRVQKVPLLSQMASLYIQLIRNTPLLVQVYLFFFALPEFGFTISPLWSAIVVLGMQTSAYLSEIYRAGIQSVPQEQWDACTALNLPRWRVWTRVVLPQSLVPIMPAIGNHINSLLKLTSYAAAIGVIELFGQGLRVAEYTYKYLVPLTLVGFIYLLISITLTVLIRRLEIRNDRRSLQRIV
ncbi:amino acid ABC transporter permease (plasmid) [Arthrobacter sp. UC242_113]|uniref:amino acid ABC transporter permease n=1 Tax=Arthrobacter sp. UC242_113 TaxID=3374550 RepID=UPI003757C8A8